MIMSRNCLLMLLFISCPIHAIAQDYYYYGHYNSKEKIPLILNESKICVGIYKDNKNVSERILANIQILDIIKDEGRFGIFDIFVISRSDYEKLASLDFWEEDAKSVILTSSFFTIEFNYEVYETPYLTVRLKKEEDADLLIPFAEKHKLRFVGSFSESLPLYYVLYVTPDSDKSPLECANEIFESGGFEGAQPDLAGGHGEATIHNFTTARKGESSKIYDLQGRKLQHAPQKGAYIQNGKKIINQR